MQFIDLNYKSTVFYYTMGIIIKPCIESDVMIIPSRLNLLVLKIGLILYYLFA